MTDERHEELNKIKHECDIFSDHSTMLIQYLTYLSQNIRQITACNYDTLDEKLLQLKMLKLIINLIRRISFNLNEQTLSILEQLDKVTYNGGEL